MKNPIETFCRNVPKEEVQQYAQIEESEDGIIQVKLSIPEEANCEEFNYICPNEMMCSLLKASLYVTAMHADEKKIKKAFPTYPQLLENYDYAHMEEDEFHWYRFTMFKRIFMYYGLDRPKEFIPALLILAYNCNFNYLSNQPELLQTDMHAKLSQVDYTKESLALLALGLFIKHNEPRAIKQARIAYLNHIYDQRKELYHTLSKDGTDSYGFILKSCPSEDALVARKVLGMLADFYDGLTRKHLMNYLKEFDRDHIKNPVAWNKQISQQEAALRFSETYSTLLHDVCVNFLVNINRGSPIVVIASTFFQYMWYELHKHHIYLPNYEDLLYLNELPYTEYCSLRSNVALSKDQEEVKNRIENILSYANEQASLIDPYTIACRVFHSDRSTQLHSRTDQEAYDVYQNYILHAFTLLYQKYPTIFHKDIEVQYHIFQNIANVIEAFLKNVQSKELLLHNETDELLDELKEHKECMESQKEEIADLNKELAELQGIHKKAQAVHDRELHKQYLKIKKEYDQQIITMTKELTSLQKENILLKQQEQELYQLREFIFSLQTNEQETAQNHSHDEQLKQYIHDHKVILVGGHLSLLQKLKNKYPDVVISMDRQVLSNRALLNGCDHIFFFTSWLNHAAYDVCMEYIHHNHVPFGYLYGENLRRIEQQLLSSIQTTGA